MRWEETVSEELVDSVLGFHENASVNIFLLWASFQLGQGVLGWVAISRAPWGTTFIATGDQLSCALLLCLSLLWASV